MMDNPAAAYAAKKTEYADIIERIRQRNEELKARGLNKTARALDPMLAQWRAEQASLTPEMTRLKAEAAAYNVKRQEQERRDAEAKRRERKRRENALGSAIDPDDGWIFGQGSVFREVRGFDRHVVRKLCKSMGQDVFLMLLDECRRDAEAAFNAELDARVDFEAMMRGNYNKYAGADL